MYKTSVNVDYATVSGGIDICGFRTEPSSHETIAAIQAYIEAHYTEELTLALLSKRFYLSSSYLCELFRKKTGYTLITYVMLVRVRHATRLIRQTGKPLLEIAELVGYENYGYFGRVFKRFMHVSPEHYRLRMIPGAEERTVVLNRVLDVNKNPAQRNISERGSKNRGNNLNQSLVNSFAIS